MTNELTFAASLFCARPLFYGEYHYKCAAEYGYDERKSPVFYCRRLPEPHAEYARFRRQRARLCVVFISALIGMFLSVLALEAYFERLIFRNGYGEKFIVVEQVFFAEPREHALVSVDVGAGEVFERGIFIDDECAHQHAGKW